MWILDYIKSSEDSPALYINQTIANLISVSPCSVTIKSRGNIILDGILRWDSHDTLTFVAQKDIILKPGATITMIGGGPLYLKAGIEDPDGEGRVVFEDQEKKQIICTADSKIHIHYNPILDNADPRYSHKYHNPSRYYEQIQSSCSRTSYMLVNDIDDLQNIKYFLSGNYALSRNIDAAETKEWNHGKGFNPITIIGKYKNPWSFSGSFDGNNFLITNLYINRSEEDLVGLFGYIVGPTFGYTRISNLKLQNAVVIGKHYVGGIAGAADKVIFENIKIMGSLHVAGNEMVGGVVGIASDSIFSNVNITQNLNEAIRAKECCGLYVGTVEISTMFDSYAPNSTLANASQCTMCEANMLWQCEANM